jgi:hypothetical protein
MDSILGDSFLLERKKEKAVFVKPTKIQVLRSLHYKSQWQFSTMCF